VFPYTQSFVISAYYSPLPCQNKYATGSYEGDIRLNGHGVHGADGTDVYPGMVAAPKTYPFGTKLYIPNIGIVAVHDRGGAILTSDERGKDFDRLDIWMGYGDEGLKRALNWGKQTVEVTVYGITDSVTEDAQLADYMAEEAIPNVCEMEEGATQEEPMLTEASVDGSATASADNETVVPSQPKYTEYDTKLALEISDEFKQNLDNYLTASLGFGDETDQVLRLQTELERLNFYRGEKTGVYDELTVHAVYKFQQSQGIVADETDKGAGYLGPKTRASLNRIVGARNYITALVAQTTKATQSTGDIVGMR
jgi:3D (Asp-Asp-Asp) domain-containing protein